ncbi:hypothetical protein [Phenylobacterium sp.]|uniref:hypothetical protein n=1 Tax=Phenylobacterium sp. TaxID=1871053 RepID=UPI0011FC4F28|nr:hypothetical protein [Phenylobacterium sp.]THD61520.1 MAG: hypothetical protein E8A49_11095 [Phenylobacterium sp.]
MILSLSLAAAGGGGPTAAAAPYHAPRTAEGTPDFEGIWSNLSYTLLERPKRYKTLIATEAQVAWALARRDALIDGRKPPPDPDAPPKPPPKPGDADPDPDDVGQATSEFPDRNVDFLRIYGQARTSLIVDPADGKLPYTPAGRKLADAADEADQHDFANPESRMPDERCLTASGGTTGPPMLNSTQNANYQILQTRGEIAILSETMHDLRIVHMGARHPAVGTHPWMGDSVGWWEGETLVIETVDQNPHDGPRFLPGGVFYLSPAAKVTERLTRISPTQIHYEFTVEDPEVYKWPWRAETMLNAAKGPIYEFACHEGNYAFPDILAGARATEKAAKAEPPKVGAQP